MTPNTSGGTMTGRVSASRRTFAAAGSSRPSPKAAIVPIRVEAAPTEPVMMTLFSNEAQNLLSAKTLSNHEKVQPVMGRLKSELSEKQKMNKIRSGESMKT